MVPVSGLLHQSFAAELRRIEGALSAAASPASPGTGLALHVFRAASCSVPSSIENISKAFPSGGFHEAPKLATAGFALRWSNPSGDQLMRWREGLRRLSKRQAFTRDHQTFAFRPPELVGIALGAQVTEAEDSALREWLSKRANSLAIGRPESERVESDVECVRGCAAWCSMASRTAITAGRFRDR